MEYHWPFAACVFFVSCFATAAVFLLWKYEGARKRVRGDEVTDEPSVAGILPAGYLTRGELWSACGGAISPNWVLLFRALCFFYLLPVLALNVLLKNVTVFFFYTEWTFTLLIVYFALALGQSSSHYLETRARGHDPEAAALLQTQKEGEEEAGVFGYVTQCVFQAVLPAAFLTDLVYWGLLVPLFLPASFRHGFVDLNMHALNLVLLTLEFCLNSLRFPWFRIGYLILWSSAYCFLQWTLHFAGVARFWPYPFMNVDTPYAPAWYFAIIAFHGVCYAICLLLALGKQSVWARFNLPLAVAGKS